jgi:hypothetical protein
MKRLALVAIATLTLTACATTGQDAYYAAIAEREKRQAEMELRADTAIAQMAQSGDEQAKGMAIMYFAQRANQARAGGQGIAPPKSTAEQLLPWAGILVPSLTQIYSIHQNTTVQREGLRANVEMTKSTNDTMLGFGGLILENQRLNTDPTLNATGDAVLWPR